ncbi:mitochondrial 54S ribosomal protein YmL17/YmL30 [Martiniozyma asiatica (nom. inval.)]|nr:mitochondrial 54S ribosomal protein YmL17/YmL30 [Martiniozyma asiatica]
MQTTRHFSTTVQRSGAIRTSLLLSRVPVVTPETPAFDAAFYKYQEELERRLMWTFPKWYYYKKGTVAEREFSDAQKYPIANNPGVWFPKGRPDLKHGRDRRFKQEVILPKKKNVEENELEDVARPIKPNSRITKADEENDLSSIERQLARTLYLVVNQNGKWILPSFQVEGEDKGLHQVAEDGLRTLVGENINTWSVSNTPAAVVKVDGLNDYIMKSHIVAGKLEAKNVSGWKWLTKEEIKQTIDNKYFAQIEHLFAQY